MKYLTNSGLSYFLNKIKAYIASQLNSKASAIHTHTKSDITDLPNGYVVDSTLDGTSSNAIANSAVVDALDGKSNTGHTHTKSQITDFPTLATVATSGSYNDLSNKPTTMTPKSHTHGNITNAGAIGSTANKPLITTTGGTVTTGSFGTSANTFCEGNDSRLSDARTPTAHTHVKSEITDFPTLATVATSGSYNDLSNKPTIPTVNNATLTIQKNGTTVKTFTANASSNVTCNITVPTKTSDLTNDSCIPLSGTNALAGSIVPNADNAYEFGSSSYGFSKIYTRYVQGSSTPKELSLFSSSKYEPWNHGAFLSLFAEDYSTDSTRTGAFMLQAKDSGNNCRFLIGYPNGTLTWGNKAIDTIEEQGNGYIRYTNGIQICWVQSQQSDSVYTWNFPKTFLVSPVVTATIYYPSNDYNKYQRSVELNNLTSTGVLLRAATHLFGSNIYVDGRDIVNAIAIGRWK